MGISQRNHCKDFKDRFLSNFERVSNQEQPRAAKVCCCLLLSKRSLVSAWLPSLSAGLTAKLLGIVQGFHCKDCKDRCLCSFARINTQEQPGVERVCYCLFFPKCLLVSTWLSLVWWQKFWVFHMDIIVRTQRIDAFLIFKGYVFSCGQESLQSPAIYFF